jgi:hypothetical protein
VPQPHADELDLEVSNDEIMRTTLDAIRNDPGFMPREQFEAVMQRKLDA